MVKQVAYTKVNALPSNVPRQLALDLLHSHEEFIRLNNLVVDVQAISAPRTAEADEYFANWYQITETITLIPGLPNKKLVFNGCWKDQKWGVQSHTIMNKLFEMRNSYRIGGNQPGEPREELELGVDKPQDGLYLREDINITCFIPVPTSFLKKNMQEASQTMIDRMKRKAELLDEGRLLALFENGKLKTMPPGTQAAVGEGPMLSPAGLTREPSRSSQLIDGLPFRRSDTLQSSPRQSVSRPVSQNDPYGRYRVVNNNNEPNGQTFVAELPENTRMQGFVTELPGSEPPRDAQQNVEGDMLPAPLKTGQPLRSELPTAN